MFLFGPTSDRTIIVLFLTVRAIVLENVVISPPSSGARLVGHRLERFFLLFRYRGPLRWRASQVALVLLLSIPYFETDTNHASPKSWPQIQADPRTPPDASP
jgi:hypothetical protein